MLNLFSIGSLWWNKSRSFQSDSDQIAATLLSNINKSSDKKILAGSNTFHHTNFFQGQKSPGTEEKQNVKMIFPGLHYNNRYSYNDFRNKNLQATLFTKNIT